MAAIRRETPAGKLAVDTRSDDSQFVDGISKELSGLVHETPSAISPPSDS